MGGAFSSGGGKKVWGDLKIFCVQNKPKKPKKISACGGRTRKDFTQGICFTAEFGHFLGTKFIFLGKIIFKYFSKKKRFVTKK